MPPQNNFTSVIAYQRLQLLNIQKLYDQLDTDIAQISSTEDDIAKEVNFLEQEFERIRQNLTSSGIELKTEDVDVSIGNDEVSTVGKRYDKLKVTSPETFDKLVEEAEDYLRQNHIDLTKDPFLQVLGSQEIVNISNSYKEKYGDISWEESDYVVVALAGIVATLLDILLVKIPNDMNFLGNAQKGSPLTKWINENSPQIHERLKPLEKLSKVPYDFPSDKVYDKEIPGLSSKYHHRLMSLGHDPILGFIFGVFDILNGSGTFIDKNGNLIVAKNLFATPEQNLVEAFIKVLTHLLSDMFTSAGIQPPFFTLLQLVKAKSPFVLDKSSGEKVSWTNVARYMYTHGYDLRHFFTMGMVPAAIEVIIRGYWLLQGFEKQADLKQEKVKIASMLLLGHTIALSGNLVKTGLIYQMNPLALNWAEILRFIPVLISWIKADAGRNNLIRSELDAEWVRIYQNSVV
ncbi:MAG: hypothetical protein Fur0044_07560 [Anaerolineae bacterium]